jgi:hypothetical protein
MACPHARLSRPIITRRPLLPLRRSPPLYPRVSSRPGRPATFRLLLSSLARTGHSPGDRNSGPLSPPDATRPAEPRTFSGSAAGVGACAPETLPHAPASRPALSHGTPPPVLCCASCKLFTSGNIFVFFYRSLLAVPSYAHPLQPQRDSGALTAKSRARGAPAHTPHPTAFAARVLQFRFSAPREDGPLAGART